MPVRPFAHSPSNDSHKAAFYARKPVGIKKVSATPNSKTQKRKANRLSGKHQPHRK